MLGETNTVRHPTRQEARRAATRAEILQAAWTIVSDEGLAALSLRDLAARVGMRAPSLYGYFASKHDIYDALFRDGYEAFIEDLGALAPERPGDVRSDAQRTALGFFDFCVAHPARHQLLFQRTIPGFEPSPESMAVAQRAYDLTVGRYQRLGIADPADLDLWTAVLTGLVDQQLANEPGGHRWRDLVGRAVDLLLADVGVVDPTPPPTDPPTRRTP